MDSLRYWRSEMHVDGFRFDLAAALGRGDGGFDPHAAFLEAVGQDPVLDGVKLIAEPWDIGRGRLRGRRLPARLERVERPLPRHRARLLARRRGHAAGLRDAAGGLVGPLRRRRPPADRVGEPDHRPRRVHARRPRVATTASTTRPTARTTATAPTTTARGTAAPRARPATPPILALRARQQRNLLATLLLSQGVPLLLARRRARAHAGRQQQRLLPGQRDELAGVAGRSAADRVRRQADPSCGARTPSSAAARRSRARRTTSSGSAPTAAR